MGRAAQGCSMSGQAHLGHLLLVQVEHLPRAGGGDLLVGQVARVGAVTTVPRQHKDHLEDRWVAWLTVSSAPSGMEWGGGGQTRRE